MPEYRVSFHESDLTLEEYLSRKIPTAPHSYLRKLLKSGKISNAQRALQPDHRTNHGEVIKLPKSARLLGFIEEGGEGLDILFESREALILNKPAGLAIHSSKGHEQNNLTTRVRTWARHRGRDFRIAPVHRIDLETSGVILFGKGRKSCSELGQLLMGGKLSKSYLALASGQTPETGELSSLIPAKNKLKEARLTFTTLETCNNASLLKITLDTGRQHQIRRQLADAGHPLFGDRRYKGPCPKSCPRLFLHSWQLAFDDPFHQQQIAVTAPLPQEFKNALQQMGFQDPEGR